MQSTTGILQQLLKTFVVAACLLCHGTAQTRAPKQSVKVMAVANVRTNIARVVVNGKLTTLHFGDPLYAGWVLKCPGGSRLEFSYLNGDFATIKPDSRPYHVRSIKPPAKPVSSIWVSAARKMAPTASIYSPPHEDGVVWPASFVFGWEPLADRIHIALRDPMLAIESTSPLWVSPQLDGKDGQYTSKEVRRLLQKFRHEHPGGQLQLTLVRTDNSSQAVIFTVLSERDERLLSNEVNQFNKLAEPQRSMAIADAYTRRRLFTEAAEEIEKASSADPESVGLRYAAIWANRRSGNREAEELQTNLLPANSAIPGD